MCKLMWLEFCKEIGQPNEMNVALHRTTYRSLTSSEVIELVKLIGTKLNFKFGIFIKLFRTMHQII